VPRLSRIHYDGKYFDYPLKPLNALRGLGLSTRCIVLSYLRAHLPAEPGRGELRAVGDEPLRPRLYEIFFKTYTEKVWGIPCTEIRRSGRRSGSRACRWPGDPVAASLNRRSAGDQDADRQLPYPRLGPGPDVGDVPRPDRGAGRRGADASTGSTALERGDGRVVAVARDTPDGERRFEADHVISTLPLRNLVRRSSRPAPRRRAARGDGLRYRDFLVVALILDQEDLFPDNWIYIHTPGVKVGRIQNFNNWSAAMVPVPGRTCLGLEYFCFEGDGLWTSRTRS
jgi:hypothetical protein